MYKSKPNSYFSNIRALLSAVKYSEVKEEIAYQKKHFKNTIDEALDETISEAMLNSFAERSGSIGPYHESAHRKYVQLLANRDKFFQNFEDELLLQMREGRCYNSSNPPEECRELEALRTYLNSNNCL